jgi:hypothetical protein
VKETTVRLTLRTLLAYLDDTLEPLEIKAIGQKVAESDTAQELIARIKQVTRRRRITTPPATGPNSFEPNMVADYLDNELSSEQVAELERICLESDVHLAEVAACHQILTLVLGEPAVVPQTAKARMYGLVRGREAIQTRKAAGAHTSAPTSEDADADEMFLLGLPFYRRGSWLRWALPIAAVLLFVGGGIALWQSIRGLQPSTTPNQVAQASNRKSEENSQAKDKTSANAESKENKKDSATQPAPVSNPPANPPEGTQRPEAKANGTNAEAKTDVPPATGKLEKTPEKTAETPATGREAPPSKERKVVGKYAIPDFSPPSLLVQRKDEKDGWSRLQPGASVSSNDQLVSLPGYASEVRLDCGVHLLLRGHVREFTPQLLVKDETGRERNQAGVMDYLQECSLVLHKPADTDADLTLERGRLYLSNHKSSDSGAAVVRFRFENKVWDLTLQPGAEGVVDLFKARAAGAPLSVLKFFLLDGNAGVALEREKYPDLSVPGWAHFSWNSTNPSAYDRLQISKQDLTFAKNTLFPKRPVVNSEPARGMERALNAIKGRMTVEKPPLIALREVLEKPGIEIPYEHRLAIYCLGAMDEIGELMNILGRADDVNAPDRIFAVVALRRWLDRGHDQERKLFDPKAGNGMLVSSMGYSRGDAQRIMELLRDPTEEQVFSSKEYYEEMAKDLANEKVAIAELARWRLGLIALDMFQLDLPKLRAFNAARPRSDRVPAMKEVMEKVDGGLLPPTENRKAGPGGGARPNPKGGSPK